MSSAEKFLNLLAQKDWVPKEVLQRLRRQVASSLKPITEQTLAKQLVQAGHLTSSQAQRLLDQLRAESGPPEEADEGIGQPAAPKAEPPGDAFTAFLEEELGLAPLEEEPRRPIQPPGPAAAGQRKPPAGEKPAQTPLGPPDVGKPGQQPPAKTAQPAGLVSTPAPKESAAKPPVQKEPSATPSGPKEPPAKQPSPKQPPGQLPASKQPSVKPQAKPGDEKPPPSKSSPPKSPPTKSGPEKAIPAKPAAAKAPPAEPGAKKKAAPPPDQQAESPLASLLEEELGALEATPTGPGDLESLLAGSAAETTAPLGPLTPVAARRSFWRRLFGKSVRPGARRRWDSPLILLGSGTLVILVLVGMVLLLVLRRESGDVLLEAAHKDFDDGAYTQAIFKYNQFLDRFGGHPAASLARVRRGIAQLRQVVEEGRDWPKAFQTAQEVLEQIAAEDAFREAHVHLSSLLPKIAQGLATEAEKQSQPALLGQAQQALELLDRYVPRSLHNQVEVDEIQGQLGQLARRFNEQAETEKTVAEIQKAIQADRPAEGYRLARTLLRQYPEADKRPLFRTALAALKDSFQKQVRRSEPNRPAQTEPPASLLQTEIPLAAVSGQPIAGLEQEIVVISFRGCLYGLEAATGNLLWRRWTGPVSDGRTPEPQPLAVSEEPGSDLIVVGAGRKELWRLERATGRLRWQNVLPGPLAAPPVLAGNHLLALSAVDPQQSRLEWIDPQTGAALRALDLPQKIQTAPAVDLRRDRIYLVGEHSYLWVLSLSDGQCQQIIPLDHAPGTIVAPPLVIADWVLVAENHRLDQAMVKLVSVAQTAQSASPVVFQEEIPGHVDTQPVVADRRVVVLSDRGAIRVYEIQTSGGKTPLARVAQRGPEGPANLIRFGLLVGQELWVAGAGLDRFEVHSAQGRLEFRPLEDPETGDIFLQPPLRLEKAVVHVRIRAGWPGVWVAAVDRQTGRRRWQTHLAVPPAGAPIPQPNTAGQPNPPGPWWVIRQSGEIFAVDVDGGKSRLVAHGPPLPFEQPPSEAGAGAGGELGGRVVGFGENGLLFMFALPADRWFLLETKADPAQWKPVVLPAPLAHWPTPFAHGLLVPTQTGRVELRDVRTGQELLAPFQPPLEPGRMPAWGQPVVIPSASPSPALAAEKAETSKIASAPGGENAEAPESRWVRVGEFLVSDGLGRIYRVGVAEKPKPHLKALGWVDLPGRLVSPLAVVGQSAWLVEEPVRAESASGPASEEPRLSKPKAPPNGPSSAPVPGNSEPAKPSGPGQEAAAVSAPAQRPAEKPSGVAGVDRSPASQPSEGKPAGELAEKSSGSAGPVPSPGSQLPESKAGEKLAGAAGRLVRLALPSLQRSEAALLEGRCIWGPWVVGEWMILATDAGQYLLADGEGKVVAQLRSEPDRPVGSPLAWEGGLLLASRTGRLLCLRAEGGVGRIDTLVHINRPLASGPVMTPDCLVLLGHDGTVYTVSRAELVRAKASAPSKPASAEPPPKPPAASESEKPKPQPPETPHPQTRHAQNGNTQNGNPQESVSGQSNSSGQTPVPPKETGR